MTTVKVHHTSKRYEGKPWVYWWDLSSKDVERVSNGENIVFGMKDSDEVFALPADILRAYLTKEVVTSRGKGEPHWGIKQYPEDAGMVRLETPNLPADDWNRIEKLPVT